MSEVTTDEKVLNHTARDIMKMPKRQSQEDSSGNNSNMPALLLMETALT